MIHFPLWQEHIRSIRSDFKPKAAVLCNMEGKLVSKSQRAKTFAGYLADKIWCWEVTSPVPVSDPSPASLLMDAPFTTHELNLAVREIKSAKLPSPNGLAGEIYKYAPYVLRLTNVSYKIFVASMIQSRLASSLDCCIRPTQFGFRKNCSTTQPIHILRRLPEVHERQPSPFHALFLDWSKAFDSVTFTAIQSAMKFMGVSPHVSRVIMSLYARPSFLASIRVQTKGLRQGCPFSPYLFSMGITHLFHDVEDKYTQL